MWLTALERWQAAGLRLAVYSSGSVAAQQLLYGHSTAGDLRELFCGWFDTRIGRKQDPASYLKIAESLAAPPARILFVSDSLAEWMQPIAAGLSVIFSYRPGNPEHDPGLHSKLTSFGRFSWQYEHSSAEATSGPWSRHKVHCRKGRPIGTKKATQRWLFSAHPKR